MYPSGTRQILRPLRPALALGDSGAGGREQSSGRVRANPQRFGSSGVEVSAISSRSLLKLLQGLGIDGDVQPHLGAADRTHGAQRRSLVQETIELVGIDLFAVLHPYIMPAQRSRR